MNVERHVCVVGQTFEPISEPCLVEIVRGVEQRAPPQLNALAVQLEPSQKHALIVQEGAARQHQHTRWSMSGDFRVRTSPAHIELHRQPVRGTRHL